MKVIILAGGRGTRISEESVVKPKPMVEIGERPILWHIMKIYASFGFNEFIICCGYKGNIIKDYFLEYSSHMNDVQYVIGDSTQLSGETEKDNWKVTLVNTGYETKTAGRVLQALKYVDDGEDFLLTYGDGVADVNLNDLIAYHKLKNKVLTISTTKPMGRFGGLKLAEPGEVLGFREKAREDQSWINIGYMVGKKGISEYLGDGSDMLEASPFERLVRANELAAYKHEGFWAPMDTVHDRAVLEQMWNNNDAPWKVW